MADKDQGDGPSLEMPTLGNLFRRKKKSKGKADDDRVPTNEDFDALVRGEKPGAEREPDEATEPASVEPEVAEAAAPGPEAAPAAAPVAEVEDEDEDYVYDEDYEYDEPESTAPAAEPESAQAETAAPESVVEEADDEPADEDVVDEPVDEDEDLDDTVIVPPVEDPTSVPDAEPPVVVDSTETEPPAEPEPEDNPTTILDLESGDLDEEDAEAEDADEEQEAKASRPKREFTLPPLAARAAAAVTGLVIGLLAVGLTYVSLRGCEAVKGTSSCGTPGFFLLLAIMIILVSVGSALLGAWKVDDPTSTSFLAVGLLAVIALLFLIRVIFSPWMVLVIPVVGVITYVASQWLTSLFEDDEEVVAS